MSTVTFTDKHVLYVKGASEIIIDCCDKFHTFSDEIIPIDEALHAQLNGVVDTMARQALRCLCLAYKVLDGDEDLETKNENNIYDVESQGLTVLAIVGIMDTLRKEVPPAIKKCRGAGVRVIMVTGDNIITAEVLAR